MRFAFVGICLLSMVAVAAPTVGLQQRSETKITAEMVGAPFAGGKPPFVWAMSFSPDGKTLALGVQFSQKKQLRFQSYLIIVPADRPNVILHKLETPTQVELKNLHTIIWSTDSRFIAITPWGDWEHAAIVESGNGELHIVLDRVGMPWCGPAEAVLPGPRIVQQCSTKAGGTAIRFLGIDGKTEPEWTFEGLLTLLQVSPNHTSVALDFPDLSDKARQVHPHKLVVFNIVDRSEVQSWTLPDARAYAGTFAAAGKEFCTVADPNVATIEHVIVCRNVGTGALSSKSVVPRGPVGISAAGDKLIVTHSGVTMLPFPIFGTDFVFKRQGQTFSSSGAGQVFSRWQTPPMDDVNFASAISQSGETVAIADSGDLRVYSVAH